MREYGPLAGHYDALTTDVPYEKWADYYERIWARAGLRPEIVLDAGCGTGSLTTLLAGRGYDMIGVDSSPDMLSAARDKGEELAVLPVYICQQLESLDLYGTVQAAVSSLDALNYIVRPERLLKALCRISLFLEPGGLFIFDAQTPAALRALHGRTIVKESERVYCVWESSFSEKTGLCTYEIDGFEAVGSLWRRFSERHRERAYEASDWFQMLEKAGFTKIRQYAPFRFTPPGKGEARWFFVAEKA